jgi:hypothetical protein
MVAMVQERTGVVICRSTPRNILTAGHFFWGLQKKCPRLSDLQIQARQQFVLDWNGPLSEEIRARPLLFMDESRFCKRSDSHWVWRRKGVYAMSILAPTEKFPRISIMVWGAIGIGYKSPPILIGGAMIGDRYLGLLGWFFTHCDDQLGHLQ